MHVERQRSRVVKKLAQHLPPAVGLHHILAQEQVAQFGYGVF